MLKFAEGTALVEVFDGLKDLVDAIHTYDTNDAFAATCHSRLYPAGKFCPSTYDQALACDPGDIAPWRDLGAYGALFKVEGGAPCMADSGVGFDVGLVCDGVPECFFADDPAGPYRPKSVAVIASVTYAGDVSCQCIEARGRALMSLCMTLASRGYDVSLTIFDAAEMTASTGRAVGFKRCKREFRAVRVNNATQLSIADLSFMMASPAFLRRLMFRCMEHDHGRDCCYGYGRVCYDLPDSLVDTEGTTLYLAGSWLPADDADAIDRLKDALNELESVPFDQAAGRIIKIGG